MIPDPRDARIAETLLGIRANHAARLTCAPGDECSLCRVAEDAVKALDTYKAAEAEARETIARLTDANDRLTVAYANCREFATAEADATIARLEQQIGGLVQSAQARQSERDQARQATAVIEAAFARLEQERDAAQQQCAGAERFGNEQEQRAITADASRASLHAALRLFAPGSHDGVWGRIKAFIVNGAPTRDEGIAIARQITEWQCAVDDVLLPSPQERTP